MLMDYQEYLEKIHYAEDDSYLPCSPCKKCSKYNETINLRLSRVTTRRDDPADPPPPSIDSPWPLGHINLENRI